MLGSSNVPDAEPDLDPQVFGSPGSGFGSIIICTDPDPDSELGYGSFHLQKKQKTLGKTFDFYSFVIS